MAAYLKYYNIETGEFSTDFETYYDKVAELADNFDCNDIAQAMNENISPKECAERVNKNHQDNLADPIPTDNTDFDYSMNY